MRFLFALLTVCLAAVAAEPRNPQRIAGGSLTTINQYPEIASLLHSYNGVTFVQECGGTILNTRSILSAAHCFYGDLPSRWRVRVGSTYANSGGILHNVATILIHGNYNYISQDNDISILRTATNILFSASVQPAAIAGANYNLADNQIVWAAGWGQTNLGGFYSEQLRHVQIWTVNQATCRTRYNEIRVNVTDNMLCAGWLDVGGRDQCQGDNGGPLYHNRVVVGVTSSLHSCGLARYPGINTRVSRYAAWIQANA